MSIKSLKNQSYTNKSFFNSANLTGGGTAAPVISSIIICDSSYNNLDDTALSPSGSYVKLIGTGFKTGCTVYFNNESLSATFVSSSEVRIQTPATTVGSYNIMLFNPGSDGGAIYLNLSVSNAPTWTTNAGTLGTQYETTSVNTSVSATGDTPITYSLFSGNLPAGTTLGSNGTLSGTAPAEASSTTYSFTVNAKDAQNQDTTRTFSLTINVDVVSWTTPTNSQVISSYEYTPISNVTLLATSAAGYSANNYTANALPTGITLAGNTISGTANTTGNTYTRLTATSNTSGRSATRDIVFNVNQDVVTWSSPADQTSYSLAGGSAMANVTLSASSAAGKTITYTANALPSGVSLSGSTIYGTPDTAQTVNTLLTATAATTNRSQTRTISWVISLGDVYWKNTTLALNATPTVTPFHMDLSNNNTMLTIAGDTRASNMNPYQDGYYSTTFSSSNYVTVTSPSIAMGTGDFTIEFWMYFTGTDGTRYELIDTGTSTIVLYRYSDNTLNYFFNGTNKITLSGFTAAAYGNRWLHFAVSRVGGSTKMFINGTQVGTTYPDTNSFTLTSMIIGYSPGAGTYWPGQVSNFRILAGTGLYSSTFTPPTTPLTAVSNTALLLFQSNRIVDNSPRNHAVPVTGTLQISPAHPFANTYQANTQYYSLNFASGNYTSSTLTGGLGAGDWTIEGWVYFTSSPGSNNGLFHLSEGSLLPSNGTGTALAIYNGLWHVFLGNNGSAGDPSGIGTTAVINRWYHFAIVRSSNTSKVYIDGVQIYSVADSYNYSSANYLALGAYYSSGYAFAGGHISNFRIVRGTAIYSGSSTTTPNFTPSTTPLTTVANTVFLGAQSSSIVDTSTNNYSITPSGTAIKPVVTSPFTPLAYTNNAVTTLGSAYFDGTGDYLTSAASAAYTFGTGDFTIEGWAYMTAVQDTAGGMFQQGTSFPLNSTTNTVALGTVSSGRVWQLYANGTNTNSSATWSLNTWYHFAVVRKSGTTKVYINGVAVITVVSDVTNYTGTYFGIGAIYFTSYSHIGYISDVHVVKGTALYTSNFLPPQAPLTPVANTQLLTCQTNGGATNNGFVDQSSFNNIITRSGNATQGAFSPFSQNGWSNYFDGSGDYLTLSGTPANFGTGDFLIEGWICMTGTGGGYPQFLSASGTTDLQFAFTSNTAIYFYPGTLYSAAHSFTLGKWYHVAWSRVSGTMKIFVDGVEKLSFSYPGSITLGTALIGGYAGGATNGAFQGYISNLRVLVGTGVTSITVPTAPLTAVANTSLLTCQNNRLIDNSPNNFTITKTGDVSVQAYSPFGGITNTPISYSNYFDGTGDFLTVPDNTALESFTDFTIEFWVYFNSIAGTQAILDKGYNASTIAPYLIQSSSGNLVVYASSNGSTWNVMSGTSFGTLSANRWYHIALTRNGSDIRLFRDGVQNGSTVTNGSTLWNNSSALGIGGGPAAGAGPFNGHLSNVRIVKGTAVYTTNFTPPTSPLTAVANTVLLTCQSATMIDNSTNNFTLTASGDVKPRPFNPFGTTNTTGVAYSPSVNGGSMYFDGTGDKLTIANYPELAFRTNNFTIQCWFYTNVLSSTDQVIATNGWASYCPWLIRIDNANVLRVNMSTSGGAWDIADEGSLGSVTAGQWYHVAITRSGSTFRGFVNGIQTWTTTSSSTLYNGSQALNIGGRSDTSVPFNGYITDVQLINGKALYTSNFYPGPAPVTPLVYSNNSTAIANTAYSTLLLNGTSGGIVDAHGSINLETVGDTKLAPEAPFEGSYYSNYFDGSGDYLTVPDNAALQLGSGDFTVEFWINYNSIAGYQTPYSKGYTAAGDMLFQTGNGNGVMTIWLNGSAVITESTGANTGQWYHYALVRSGTTVTLYRDGVSRGTATSSVNFNTTNQLAIGATGKAPPGGAIGDTPVNGYMSNVRVVKGTAVYTTSFTPSTTPLTALSGTSLLTCQSNSLRDNSTNAFTITRNGNVAVKSFNPFKRNTGQSIYFDGTGDSLFQSASTNYTFGTGDFTIEFWINFTSTTNRQDILWISTTGAATDRLGISWNLSAGNLTYYISPTIGNAINAAWTPTTGQWYNIALCRSSGSTKLFINGIQSGSTYTDSRNYNSQYALYVGQDSTGQTSMFNGYLRDLRITKGIARYTSNNQVNLTSTFEVK